MKKILILGGSGLVGSTLIEKAENDYMITATFNKNKINSKHCKSIQFIIRRDLDIIHSLINDVSPDIVVNTIAYSDVDFCETHQDEAKFLHVDTTREIAKICNELKIKLIYISTDWVFGNGKNHNIETDIPNPINFYGKSRVMAEEIVRSSSNDNVILRPSVIYGWHKNSRFLNFVLKNLENNSEVNAFNDQYSSPTLVDDLVECIKRIIEKNVKGTFHTVGPSCVNRYEFATEIAKIFGLNIKLIKSVNSNQIKQIAKRPSRCCLDNSLIQKTIGINFSTIESGLQKVYKKSKSL